MYIYIYIYREREIISVYICSVLVFCTKNSVLVTDTGSILGAALRCTRRGSLASIRGWDKRGSHRRATTPHTFSDVASKCARLPQFDICCHMCGPHVPVNVHQGESRHFCGDP